jgi:pimeloyl-ACP methyl ester carboxylesterase
MGVWLAAHGVRFHNIAVSSALASLDVAAKVMESRSAKSLYCYGVSMGALIGLHASLLYERIRGLILSGVVREDKSLLQQGVYDSMIRQGEIYPTLFNPGTWRYGFEKAIDMWTPRPLFIEVGDRDSMSGMDQGRDRVLQNIQSAYTKRGKVKNFKYSIFNGAHEANGVAAINWLKRFDV